MIVLTEIVLLVLGIIACIAGYGFENERKRATNYVLSIALFILLIWCLGALK